MFRVLGIYNFEFKFKFGFKFSGFQGPYWTRKVEISQNFVAFSEYMNFISNFHIKMIKSVLYCLNSFKNSMRKIYMYQIVHLFSSRNEK